MTNPLAHYTTAKLQMQLAHVRDLHAAEPTEARALRIAHLTRELAGRKA